MLDVLIHKYLNVPYQLHAKTNKAVARPQATVVFLHGIGNSSASWNEVTKKLPKDIRVISIDLLGFGQSPSPRWLKYNTRIQARSVFRTLFRLGISQQIIIVGHSMGSLVAVELAKRYPLLVKSLILCSPPFYTDHERHNIITDPNKILKDFYRLLQKHPETLVDLAPIAVKLKIVSKAFDVTDKNVDVYMAALESSIINQDLFKEVKRLQKPIQIIHGALDPVVIKKNLTDIVRSNKHASLSVILAGHELLGAYVPAVIKAVGIALKR